MKCKSATLEEIIEAHKLAAQARSLSKNNRYPKSFKKLVARAMEHGLSATQIQKATGVNTSTLRSWFRLDASSEPKGLTLLPVTEEAGVGGNGWAILYLPSGVEMKIPPELIHQSLLPVLMRRSL